MPDLRIGLVSAAGANPAFYEGPADPVGTSVAIGPDGAYYVGERPDGRLYVTQIEDRSWLAFELVAFEGVPLTLLGGSVHACNLAAKACQRVVSGKPRITSITFRSDGMWGATKSFFPRLDVTGLLP